MRKIYLALVLMGALFVSSKGYSQISVTATSGTMGPTSYTTLNGAITAINAGTHTGAITISVTGNTTETAMSSLNSSGSGSASYTSVLIKPATGVTATISSSAIGAGSAILKLNGADNVTVDGSNTTGGTTKNLSFITSGGANAEIWLSAPNAGDGATNNTIKNCILTGTSAATGGASIASYGTAIGTQPLTNNTGNTFQNNTLGGHQLGIATFSSSNFPYDQNLMITGNTITGVAVRGIFVQGASDFTVSNNTVTSTGAGFSVTTANTSGIYVGYFLSNGNVFGNNISTTSNGSGSSFGAMGITLAGPTSANVNVYNNFISNSVITGGSSLVAEQNAYGIDISTGGGYNIYYNTISLGTNSTGLASAPIFVSSGIASSSLDIRNNILVNTQTAGATTRTAIYSAAASSVFTTIDNNDYYATSGILGFIGSANKTTLAQMITGFGGNANSISVNPTFVSSTNLDLQNVTANEPLQIAVPISSPAITTDIHGTARSNSHPVAGADELIIPPVISYTSPTPSCGNNDIVLSGVTITDFFGVPTTGSLMPRIYFRKNGGTWFSAPGTLTSGTGTSGTWSFTISASTLSGLAAGNTITYFVIAQNTNNTVVSNPSTGLVASDVNTVTVKPTTPNSFNVSALPTVSNFTSTSSITCVGSPVTFNAGSVTGVGALTSYNWSGPNSFSAVTTSSSLPFTPSTTLAGGQYSLSVTYPGIGCTSNNRTLNLTVNSTPSAITGTPNTCVGSTTLLTDATSGGTWVSGNTGVATIASTSGILTGVTPGVATISYIVSGVCVVTAPVTVNPNPPAISGTPAVCVGLTTTLSDATTGGTWISNNPSKADVDAGGVVTGYSAGTAVITYTLSTGCHVTSVINVNSNPTISGPLHICTSNVTVLSGSPAGGTWSTDDASVATTSGSSTILGIGVGTANVTYTVSTGCLSTAVVTVTETPAAITGPTTVCVGGNITLSDATSGGNWTPTSGTIAYANFTTGVVTGVSTGTTSISYTLPTGCMVTYNVTGIALPPTIGGTFSLCQGGTTTLTNGSTGGTWTSSNSSVASIGSGTGFVTAASAGTATITYTAPSGCYRTAVFTVNPVPASIGGPSDVCIGSSVTLTNSMSGGTWLSSNVSIASIGNTTGIVTTSVSAGTVTISYRLATGCQVTSILSVNPLPNPITGAVQVCQGSSIFLSETSTGGVWSVTNFTGSATVSSGTVTGVTPGTAVVSYAFSTGCARSLVITINPVPAAIGGTMSVCQGFTATVTDASPSGVWSSSAPTIAPIGAGSGTYTGSTAGTATITYKFTTGCQTTAVVSVNSLPAAITGSANVCLGQTTTLSNSVSGGTWTSMNPGVATITSGGVVTGMALGTATISYTLTTTGCAKSIVVTVNSLPGAITGTRTVCVGSTTNLASTPGGGTWSSADPSIATAAATPGVIAGVSAGTVNITYSMSTGCLTTAVVTVYAVPSPITGANSVCEGSTTTLSTITTGGTWTSSNVAVGTIDALGNVTGVHSGSTTITYTLSTGCAATKTIVVNPLPVDIFNPSLVTVCQGSSITLLAGGTGTWSSSDVLVATIGGTSVGGSSSAIVTGVSVGTTVVSYIISTGCYRTRQITVNPTPSPIGGALNVCTGSTTTLTDADPTGVWSSGLTPVAVINSSTGVVSGISAGTANISYTFGTGCRATAVVTVFATPAGIVGASSICEGGVTTLSDAQPGGTWSSDNTSVANVTLTTGVLSGNTAGTANITYTSASGNCFAVKNITVNAIPAAVTGLTDICVGSTTTLSSTTPGGTWQSSNVLVASAGATTGIITGISTGTANITYRLGTGCFTTYVMTIDPLPATINGVPTVCVGNTNTLTTTATGGTWTSSNPTLANIDIFGTVTGIAAGTATITYTLSTGCFITRQITVNALPSTIGGVQTVCTSQSTTLTNSVLGGVWSSGDLAVATVGSLTGIVTGGSAGTVDITYMLSTGCMATAVVTVNQSPSPITGTPNACLGAISDLDDATLGGTWSSNNSTIASVDPSTGVVIGVAAGSTTISYTDANNCSALRIFTVQPLPNAFIGTPAVCTGQTTTLTTFPTTGTWTSSDPVVASVTGGVISGLANGTSLIVYTLPSGCSRSVVVTVNSTPPPISGPSTVCVGATSSLSDGIIGGTWVSNFPSLASVGYNTGVVTGVAQGIATVTYTLLSGCKTYMAVTVQATPGPIAGTASICQGSTSVLTNTLLGGSWSSSNTTVATIGSGSGILVGMNPGTATITYTLISTGCQSTRVITVNALPAPITGSSTVCVGSQTTLSSTSLGGTWSTSNASVASAGASTGVITGVTSNTVTVIYTLPSSCTATFPMTVNPLPNSITGPGSVCVGSSAVLTNVTPGGTWSLSNPVLASIDPLSGIITGTSQGTIVVTYTLGTSCYVTRTIVVKPVPSAIIGNLNVCEGSTSPLTNLTPGGSWASGNTFVATINATNGILTGNVAGNTLITYTVASTGCMTTAVATVNPLPYSITGNTAICLGSTNTLGSLSTGGSWSSSNTLVATIGSSTGDVTGNGVGTARVTYILPTGCRVSTVVTVNPLPANIIGINTICAGSSTTLSDPTGGGNWSSSNNSIATVNSSGKVDGVAAGVATITYSLGTSCSRTIDMTVNPTPSAITGTTTVCRGSTTTLSNTMTGGIWTSSNATVATVLPDTGVVTGVNPGTAIITYSTSSGCKTWTTVSVSPVPAAITGQTLLCNGSTVTLSNTVPGGSWSSDFTFVAIVDAATGVVTGSGPGVTPISYILPGGCSASITVTVNPAAPNITGDSIICVNTTSHLSNATVGGTWSSSNPAIVTIGLGDGTVTGISAGAAYITYTLGAGCRTVTSVTVNPSPSPIAGPNIVCAGQTITLTNTMAGGTWQSDDVSVASVVYNTGVVTGVTGNIDTIRYTLPGGCYAKFGITVNPTPPVIDQVPLKVCQGLTLTLTDLVSGGVWTSSDPSIAPITPTPASNVILGLAPGTVTISYTLATSGCATSAILTVNPTSDAITGNFTLCEGATSALHSTSIGGSWSSSNPAVATIGSGTGVVTGITHGISTMTYTLPTGCITTALIVVNPNPAPITGPDSLCVGSNTSFTNVTPFGTWSSSASALVSIGSGTGFATGIAAGNAILTYTLGSTGCYSIKQVTVNTVPPPVTGNPYMCVGSVTFLSNAAAPGGTWSSSNPAVGTVDGFGDVSGISAGTTVITYTRYSACYTTAVVTVEPIPLPITGPSKVCVNATIVLTDGFFGGEWSTGNGSIATVNTTTGVVTGVAQGTVTITYATPAAHCYVTTSLTVDPVPVAVVGIDSVCEASTATYFDGTTGGTWSTSNVSIATIAATGILTAVAPDTVTVSYTIPNGCFASKLVTVQPLAHAGTIAGPAAVCVNTTVTLNNTTAAPIGKWYSSDTSIAKVDSITGIVSGIAAGTVDITYISTNNCSSDTTTASMLVNPQPDAGTLSGVYSLCKDYTSTISSTVPGGVWTSSNTSVATVSNTGVVTAIVPGTSTISYAVTNVCGTDTRTVVVTVNLVAPHTNITVHPDSFVCLNAMYQNFGTDSAAPAGLIYRWSATNAVVWAQSANGQNSVINFPNAGVATVKLTTQIAATGCFVVDSFSLNVSESEAHHLEVQYYNLELICTDNTADYYQWGYDDKVTLDSNLLFGRGYSQQSYYLPEPDFNNKNYWVITGNNGCFQKTYYNVPTGVTQVTSSLDIKLFPNPAESRLNIEVGGTTLINNITVKVIDMFGKEVGIAALVDGKGSINVYDLPAGMYTVMFTSEGTKLASRTFVKK